MSSTMTPSMAEREAELAALQAAFDEYIASSRELEEELDAELAKMRKSSGCAQESIVLASTAREFLVVLRT